MRAIRDRYHVTSFQYAQDTISGNAFRCVFRRKIPGVDLQILKKATLREKATAKPFPNSDIVDLGQFDLAISVVDLIITGHLEQ
jgi:hypothetical protein